MSVSKTVNQGWVKINLPKPGSVKKVRTKKPDWIRVKLPIGKKYEANPGWLKKNKLSSTYGFSKVRLPPH